MCGPGRLLKHNLPNAKKTADELFYVRAYYPDKPCFTAKIEMRPLSLIGTKF